MPFPKPSAAASSLALLAALATPAPGHAREARTSDETVAQEAGSAAVPGPDDIIFVMRPLRPLTGAAAPAKKPAATADKGAQPSASKPAEQQKPATPDMAVAAGVEPEAPANPAVPLDLPTVALNATIAMEEWNAPSRAFDWEPSRLQLGPPPPFLPPLDPAPATAAAEPAAESQAAARIAALLAEGQVGPAEVRLADRATMLLPAGRVFIPLDAARSLAREMGLDWRAGMQGFVTLADGSLDWLAPVELLDEGHIDPGAIEPDKSLATIGERLPGLNERRAAAGQAPATIEGWLAPPALDANRLLSACAMVSTAGLNVLDRFINCEAFVLGREGAIKIGLIERAEKAASLKSEISALAGKVVFDHGKTYEEFDAATDRVAPFHAADLLLQQIGVKASAPSEAATKAVAAGGTILGRLSIVASMSLFGAAAVFLFLKFFMRRFRVPMDAPTDPEPAGRRSPEAETPKPEGDAAPARSIRMSPALRTSVARRGAPEPAAPTAAEQAQDDALAARTARVSRPRSVAEPRVEQTDVQPLANEAEEPVSALRSYASRMRGDAESQPAAVDPGRVPRRRGAGGAAPAYEESLDLGPAIQGEAAEAGPSLGEAARRARTAAEKPAAVVEEEPPSGGDQDPFGLIEPGDAPASARARQMRAEPGRSDAG